MLMVKRTSPTETWRDALARVGEYLGISWELLKSYDDLVRSGVTPELAVAKVTKDWKDRTYGR
jgi:ketol-acid reductoisomerase